jgi:hypothetical protein
MVLYQSPASRVGLVNLNLSIGAGDCSVGFAFWSRQLAWVWDKAAREMGGETTARSLSWQQEILPNVSRQKEADHGRDEAVASATFGGAR